MLQWMEQFRSNPNATLLVGLRSIRSDGAKAIWVVNGASDLSHSGVLLVFVGSEPEFTRFDPSSYSGQLWLGAGRREGEWAGIVDTEGGVRRFQRLELPGTGMYSVECTSQSSADLDSSRWSRTVGALGDEAWLRMIRLRIVLVGCGRNGSVMANALARLGVQSLIIIDPDLLEPHNLGEMEGVFSDDVGQPKVNALASHLTRVAPDLQLQVVPHAVHQAEGRQALRQAQLIVSCVDNDTARLACAIAAVRYHLVLLDVGSGVFGTGQERVMGADIRLILPGDGCLLEWGHLGRFEAAVDELAGLRVPQPPLDWRTQRAGSLRSLNELAVGTALQMLQDLMGERIHGSIWARLEIDPEGRISVRYPAPTRDPACRLCAKSGWGDG